MMRPTDVRLMEVIYTSLTQRGDGKETVMRRVIQYWSKNGLLLAEVDPMKEREEQDRMRKIIEEMHFVASTKKDSIELKERLLQRLGLQ